MEQAFSTKAEEVKDIHKLDDENVSNSYWTSSTESDDAEVGFVYQLDNEIYISKTGNKLISRFNVKCVKETI